MGPVATGLCMLVTFLVTVVLALKLTIAVDERAVARGMICIATDCYRLTKIDGARP